MIAASYPFLDVLWSMVIFFMFFIWIMDPVQGLRGSLPPS